MGCSTLLCWAFIYKYQLQASNEKVSIQSEDFAGSTFPPCIGLRGKPKEASPQKAWDSYTQFALLNPEQPTQMVRKVGQGATPLPGSRKPEIAG